MSILLINTLGLVACTVVVVAGVKSVYRNSQAIPPEEDYEVEIPLSERNITADIVGLGVEIVGFGIDVLEDVSEKMLETGPSNWLRERFSGLQVKPDGHYLKFRNGDPNEWNGYCDETPKSKPGKFEMEI